MAAVSSEDTPLVSKSDAANFRQLKQRWFMHSRVGAWTALVLGCVTLSITSVPHFGWQTLQQNMIDEGCQYSEDQLDEIGYWASGLSVAGILPAGMLFDHFGPLAVGVGGMVAATMGICGLSAALIFSNHLNWLLGPSYVTAVISINFVSFSLLAYLWILYEHPVAVLGVCQASVSIASILVLLSVWLTSCCGVTAGTFFLVLGLGCLASVLILHLVLPTYEETLLLMKYSHSMLSSLGEVKPSIDGIFLATVPDEHGKDKENKNCIKLVRQRLWDMMCIAFQMHPGVIWIFFGNSFTLNMAIVTLSFYQYSFYQTMFSEEQALYLVDLMTVVSALLGLFVAVSIGVFIDKSGVKLSILSGNCAGVIFVILVVIPSIASQITAMVICPFVGTYFILMTRRFAQLYAPQELYGTFLGIFALIASCCQTLFEIIFSKLTSAIFSEGNSWQYRSQFLFWGGGVLLTGFLFAWWIHFQQPLKKPGVASMSEIYQFQSQAASENLMKDSASI